MFLKNLVQSRVGIGLVIALVQLVVAGILVSIQELSHNTNDSSLETALAIWHGIGGYVLPTVATTIIIVEGGAMVFSGMRKKHFEKGRVEGKKEGAWEVVEELSRLSEEDRAKKLRELRKDMKKQQHPNGSN